MIKLKHESLLTNRTKNYEFLGKLGMTLARAKNTMNNLLKFKHLGLDAAIAVLVG